MSGINAEFGWILLCPGVNKLGRFWGQELRISGAWKRFHTHPLLKTTLCRNKKEISWAPHGQMQEQRSDGNQSPCCCLWDWHLPCAVKSSWPAPGFHCNIWGRCITDSERSHFWIFDPILTSIHNCWSLMKLWSVNSWFNGRKWSKSLWTNTGVHTGWSAMHRMSLVPRKTAWTGQMRPNHVLAFKGLKKPFETSLSPPPRNCVWMLIYSMYISVFLLQLQKSCFCLHRKFEKTDHGSVIFLTVACFNYGKSSLSESCIDFDFALGTFSFPG